MKRTSTPPFRVALLVETSTKIGRDLLQGIQSYARETGLWNLDLQPGGLNQVLPNPKTWKGTGIVSRAANPGTVAAILKTRLPAVFFTLSSWQRKALAGREMLEVLVDADSVSQLAANHLLERGLRNLAFVGHARNPEWSGRREQAFARSLAGESIVPHVYPVDSRENKNWARESRRLRRWLEKLPKPVGIMAANDARGLQVLDACRQGALSVPDEVAVIGVDNDELICSLCHPPLTSIVLATTEAGYRSARALHALILKKRVRDCQILIPAIQIIARESTATAVAQNWRVEKARRFILQKAGEMIQVRNVVEHVGISRRSLEAHFSRSVGHSLLQEILRVRIERVKGLLLSSASPIHLIAEKGGFSNANYMCKAFKKAVGCSPQTYRLQTPRINRH